MHDDVEFYGGVVGVTEDSVIMQRLHRYNKYDNVEIHLIYFNVLENHEDMVKLCKIFQSVHIVISYYAGVPPCEYKTRLAELSKEIVSLMIDGNVATVSHRDRHFTDPFELQEWLLSQ